jgi:hypothetical protein
VTVLPLHLTVGTGEIAVPTVPVVAVMVQAKAGAELLLEELLLERLDELLLDELLLEELLLELLEELLDELLLLTELDETAELLLGTTQLLLGKPLRLPKHSL